MPGITAMLIESDNRKSAACLVYDDASQVGMFAQMTPSLARSFGASLIHLANLIEPPGGN